MSTVLVACLMISGEVAQGGFVLGEPTRVPEVGVSEIAYPQISRDGLELYFKNTENSCTDIWVMRRSSTQEAWSDPVKLEAPVNSVWPEAGPCISPNGLEFYFSDAVYSDEITCGPHPNGHGEGDLWVTKRASKDDAWGIPENLGPLVNSAQHDDSPSLSADGLSLYFQSDRSSGQHMDLYVLKRPSLDDPWGPAENVGGPVNTSKDETTPFLSPDGLSLYFSAAVRQWSYVSAMYVSRRQTVSSPWESPMLLEATQMPGLEYNFSYSQYDSAVYVSNTDNFYGRYHLWKIEVTLVVDFNEDGAVDEADAFALVLNWGPISNHTLGEYPLHDIAPFPFGDGVVDAKDLLVLAEHMIENTEETDDTVQR